MDVPKSPRGTAARKSRYWTSHGPVEPELPLHRGHLLARGGLVDEERGGIAGQADEEEDDGHDAPDHDDGVDEAPQEEPPHRLRYFRRADGAEVHVQLGQRLEAHDAGAQRVDLDLLVERNDRRPVADLLLEVGEEREPLLGVELAAGRLVELGQLRRERRPVDQGDRGPVAHVVVGIEVVAGAARGEPAIPRQRALGHRLEQGGEVHRLDVDLDADRLQHLGHRRRGLVEALAIVLGGKQELQREHLAALVEDAVAVRVLPARLGEQRLRALRVVGVGLLGRVADGHRGRPARRSPGRSRGRAS